MQTLIPSHHNTKTGDEQQPQQISTQYLQNTTTPAKHPATIRALCRRLLQQNDFQGPHYFTGPAPLDHPNGTVPFPLETLFSPYGTLLTRTFAASLAALGSAKCVSGPKLRLALTANQTPAQPRLQPPAKVESFRPAQPARW